MIMFFAALLANSPFDILPYLPIPFKNVYFSCRCGVLFMFVTNNRMHEAAEEGEKTIDNVLSETKNYVKIITEVSIRSFLIELILSSGF